MKRALLLEFVGVDLAPEAHAMNIDVEIVRIEEQVLSRYVIRLWQVQGQVLLHVI